MEKADFRQETINIALRGIGQTNFLIKYAQSKEEKSLAVAMQEAFVNLWKKMEDD